MARTERPPVIDVTSLLHPKDTDPLHDQKLASAVKLITTSVDQQRFIAPRPDLLLLPPGSNSSSPDQT